VFAVAYYPFIPYDMAAKFESEILLMKALETNPAGWNQAYGQFSNTPGF